MTVSAIIPALNEQSRIADSVRRAWEAGCHEVIVVDGGSVDGTAEIAASADCQLVLAPCGRASQQNAGAAVATGELLCFLHADTWLAAGGVEQIRDAAAHPGCTHGAFRQRIAAAGIAYRWLEHGNAARVRWWGIPYGDQGIFVRRKLFTDCGGFPDWPLMEDVGLMRTLRRTAWPRLLAGPLHVDARRWQKYGVVRQTLRNWSLLTAFRLGVSPTRLACFYPRHDRQKMTSAKNDV